jgi:hypothetical protein
VTRIALRRSRHAARHVEKVPPITGATHMSKGKDRKKETKKKPTKTLEEKRAAKRAKKEGRGFTI